MTRTIAVTGVASGIGAKVAALLKASGDRVIGFDIVETETNVDQFIPLDLGDPTSIKKAAAKVDGVGAGAVGYYSMESNRVRMFDLTGSDELRGAGRLRAGSRREIAAMLKMRTFKKVSFWRRSVMRSAPP